MQNEPTVMGSDEVGSRTDSLRVLPVEHRGLQLEDSSTLGRTIDGMIIEISFGESFKKRGPSA